MIPEKNVHTSGDASGRYNVAHWHCYRELFPLVKNKRVLDLACGKGFGAALMAGSALQVTGVDAGDFNINYATKKFGNAYRNLNFFKTSYPALPVEAASIEVCIYVYDENNPVAIDENLVAELKNALQQEGIFVMVLPATAGITTDVEEVIGSSFKSIAYAVQNGEVTMPEASLVHHSGPDTQALKNNPVQRQLRLVFASNDIRLPQRLGSLGYAVAKDIANQDKLILEQDAEIKTLRHALAQLTTAKENLEAQLFQNAIAAEESRAATAHAEALRRQLDALRAQLQDQEQVIAALTGKLVAAKALEKRTRENTSLQAEIALLQQTLKEKEQLLQDLQFNFSLTRQQFSEVNNRLLTIYDSDGWKVLERYYTLKGKFLHEQSAHYKLFKNTINFLRNKKEGTVAAPLAASRGNNKTKAAAHAGKKEIVFRSLPFFEVPAVSIIIPVYNAWEMNEKCIASIIEHTTDVAYEVIVADDGSTDETKDIATYFKNVVHIRNEKNLGFLENCNNAAAHARGQYLHFLNNDTEVKAGWLSALVRVMENDAQAGMVGSKLIYPDGRLQEAGGIIWNDASGWNYGQGQNPELPEFNYVKEADYISGASLMIRASLWNEIGGFDARYAPAYCEDSDLAFAVREKGYKVVYQPLSEVVHYEGYSHGSDREQSAISSIKEYQVINNKKFFEKWKAVLQRDQFPNAVNVFWAKDRSHHKKTLLMVDHYVPQFDKDAGSRTTFQYLQLFVKLGFNIKFLGENFYRHEPYTTVLQQMGIEVLYGPWYRDNWKQWFIENSDKFDYIYLNRPHISINFIDFFRQHSKAKILYYGHDLHFLREQKRYELEKNSAILEDVQKWKDIESYLFSRSDVILTPSLDEQQVIQALNPTFNVQLMRPFIYKTVSKPIVTFEHRKDLLFVGGFGHLPNVDGVLWFANEVWPFVKVALPAVRFIIAGSHPPDAIKALASDAVIVKGYVSDDELEQLYATCKIAVIPLRYGAGVKGKTVEAMRYGMPIVTTSFGIEGLPGDYSFLQAADNASEFAAAVLELYQNDASLTEQSIKGTEYIKANFSVAAAENILTDILTNSA